MKNKITLSLILAMAFVMIFLALASPVAAQSYRYSQENYWHTQDSYSVELDGEGDAFVVATMTFEGIHENAKTNKIYLEIPNRNIKVYKVIQIPYANYRTPTTGAKFLDYTLNTLSGSTQMIIDLETPVTSQRQTSISVIYQTQDIAKPSIQGLIFGFETIKDSHATIRNVGANIYVPDDMQLKDKPKMTTQYLPSMVAGYSSSLSASEMATRIQDYRSYPYQSYHYSAKNLDPGESFTVSGLYGDNAFLMHLWEIWGVIVTVLTLGIVFKFVGIGMKIRRLFSIKPSKPSKTTKRVKKTPETHHVSFSFERPLLMGIAAGVLYVITSSIIQAIGNFGYGYYNFMALIVLVFFIMFTLPFLALLSPPFYIYKKHGWKEGMLTFIVAIIAAFALMFSMMLIFG